MTSGRSVYLLVLSLAMTEAFSISYTQPERGRKLFGGYRIVPKVCQPTNPSRIKPNEPAICMFNYECTRRNGEVVGACMDGFLFGACCQLPSKHAEVNNLEKVQGPDNLLSVYQIDHAPEIPILLNPDGTPVGSSSSLSPTKSQSPSILGGSFTKISTIGPTNHFPSTNHFQNTKTTSDSTKKPQINYSSLEQDIPNLFGQQQMLDDLQLPGLLTHSDSNNDIQDHQDTAHVSPVTTLLNADQILQIADPVDQLPVLFSQGIANNNQTGPETILLSENGTVLQEVHNPDEIFKPTTSSTKLKISQSTPAYNSLSFSKATPSKKSTTKLPILTQKYAYSEKLTSSTQSLKTPGSFPPSRKPDTGKINGTSTTGFVDSKATASKVMSTFETTTPMNLNKNKNKTDLVRVPTITYDAGNKKHDELDREEIAINHIISILNDTTPSSDTKFTSHTGNTASSWTQNWVSIDETSKPSVSRIGSTRPSSMRPSSSMTTESLPYTYFNKQKPPSNYYYYQVSTEGPGSTYSSQSSQGSGGTSTYLSSRLPLYTTGTFPGSSGLTTRPTTNPPAPTVIVLGPLGTEYTTSASQKPSTRRPTTTIKTTINTNPGTKKPVVSTTITHNISTVISGSTLNNKHVVSTSYISVNLKDGTTSVRPSTPSTTEKIVSNTTPTTKQPFWTSVSPWPTKKPTFLLKPSFDKNSSQIPITSTASSVEDETAAPDDSIIFPPVRHPELNISNAVVQQENPTLVLKGNDTDYPDNFIVGDIPTPAFIEDDVLKNKVDSFVNKIVDSLQGNFDDLKEVVYTKANTTVAPPIKTSAATKRPTLSPTKKPKPSQVTVKKPVTKKPTTIRPTTPASGRPTTLKSKPTAGQVSTTKKAVVTTKRPKPTKKVTTTPSTELVTAEDVSTVSEGTTTGIPDLTSATDHQKVCGIRPHVKAGRIVGGKGAVYGEWPWQVLVRESTWLGLFTKNKCGGVLITNKYVITAAHCQPGFLASLIAVFGEHDISGELEAKRSVTKNVKRVIVHKGYDAATFENDLALLELESPVQFDTHIVPICMPDDNEDFTGQMATVTGWGRLKYNGGVPSVLQVVHVPVMENSVCQEMFQMANHPKLILNSFLCAGYATGLKDSCEGDSGGPLTMQRADGRWVLVGTVSHGIKCAAPYMPGVYMRTTYFKPWLQIITGV